MVQKSTISIKQNLNNLNGSKESEIKPLSALSIEQTNMILMVQKSIKDAEKNTTSRFR